MDLNLRGKNVLITGSTQGIGRRIANLFAEEGANVAICSRSPESVNKAIKEISLMADGKIIGSPCNIKNKEDFTEYLINFGDKVVDKVGKEVNKIESKIKKSNPDIKHIDLETH